MVSKKQKATNIHTNTKTHYNQTNSSTVKWQQEKKKRETDQANIKEKEHVSRTQRQTYIQMQTHTTIKQTVLQ